MSGLIVGLVKKHLGGDDKRNAIAQNSKEIFVKENMEIFQKELAFALYVALGKAIKNSI